MRTYPNIRANIKKVEYPSVNSYSFRTYNVQLICNALKNAN